MSAFTGTASWVDSVLPFIYAMDLRRIRHREDLKNYLSTSLEHVTRLIEGASSEVFSQHWIRKRNGGWREVWELRDTADSDVYKTFARLLDGHFRETLPGYPHPASHGYVRGRSTLTNAKRHVGATKILKADLRAFFRNVTTQKVKSVLRNSNIQADVLDDFLRLLVWDDHVPLGLCTSPILVNAVALNLDSDMEQLAVGGRYTRYSDDLTFSGPPLPSVDALKLVVERHDFQLAEEKSHYLERGRGLTVTGLTVETDSRPHVPKAMKRRIRQELYYATKFGLREHAGRRGYGSLEGAANRIHGTVQYIRGIDRGLGDKLHHLSCQVLFDAGVPVSISGASVNDGAEVQFLFDESTPSGTKAQILCLTVVEDVSVVGDAVIGFLDDLRSEPEALNVELLDAKGLHWVELHFDHRTKAVEFLRTIPFRSFVAYRQNPTRDYRETYEELLLALIKDRLRKHHGRRIRVLVEENSQLSLSRLSSLLQGAFDEVDRTATRARGDIPRPVIEFFKKNSVATAPLPDLVLGVVGEYLNAKKSKGKAPLPGAQAKQRYRWIEGKVRAVYDLDGNRVFSRRKPLPPWEEQT